MFPTFVPFFQSSIQGFLTATSYTADRGIRVRTEPSQQEIRTAYIPSF